MVPIQYFLALLALLTAVGCTQKAPPGSIELTRNANKTTNISNLVEPSPSATPQAQTQVIHKNEGNQGKPSIPPVELKADDTSVPFQLFDDKIVLGAQDAAALYSVLEVRAEKAKAANGDKILTKTSSGIVCSKYSKPSEGYLCVISFDAKTGAIHTFTANKESEPDQVLKAQYSSAYITLDVASGTEKNARMILYYDAAAKLYKDMIDQDHVRTVDAGVRDGYTQRTTKKGENVSCTAEKNMKTNQFEYNCWFWFAYNTGTFEKIE